MTEAYDIINLIIINYSQTVGGRRSNLSHSEKVHSPEEVEAAVNSEA